MINASRSLVLFVPDAGAQSRARTPHATGRQQAQTPNVAAGRAGPCSMAPAPASTIASRWPIAARTGDRIPYGVRHQLGAGPIGTPTRAVTS
jgi:hypothetical protein